MSAFRDGDVEISQRGGADSYDFGAGPRARWGNLRQAGHGAGLVEEKGPHANAPNCGNRFCMPVGSQSVRMVVAGAG